MVKGCLRPWGLQQSVKNPDGLGSGLTGVDGILLLSYLFGEAVRLELLGDV